MPKRTFFHCTTENHGPRFVAIRRAPLLRSPKEPTTPRICVCPSVARCFSAVLLMGDVYVYRTEKPVGSVAPRDVWDSELTRERWLIPPVAFVLDRVIPSKTAQSINGWTLHYLAAGRCGVSAVARLCQWAIAAQVIDSPLPEKNGREKSCRRLGLKIRSCIC